MCKRRFHRINHTYIHNDPITPISFFAYRTKLFYFGTLKPAIHSGRHFYEIFKDKKMTTFTLVIGNNFALIKIILISKHPRRIKT